MTNSVRSLVALTAAAALPFALFAQSNTGSSQNQDYSRTSSQQQDQNRTSSSMSDPAHMSSSSSMSGSVQVQHVTDDQLERIFTAKDLIGKDVYGRNGEKLGSIDDVVIEMQATQQLASAMLRSSTSGSLAGGTTETSSTSGFSTTGSTATGETYRSGTTGTAGAGSSTDTTSRIGSTAGSEQDRAARASNDPYATRTPPAAGSSASGSATGSMTGSGSAATGTSGTMSSTDRSTASADWDRPASTTSSGALSSSTGSMDTSSSTTSQWDTSLSASSNEPAVLLSTGGLFSRNTGKVRIPVSSLRFENDRLTCDLTEDQVKQNSRDSDS